MDQGANRVCYVHPNDSAKLLKIIKPWKRACHKRGQAPWFKRLRPASCFDDNLIELKAFKSLQKKQHYERHFPRCYGLVQTDMGEALCVEYIRSGSVDNECQSLEAYLQAHGFTEEIVKALDELACFLYNNAIITRDLRCFNIMLRITEQGINLIIVDGLGNSEFLPVSDFFPALGRIKIKRKLKRFQKRLQKITGSSGWKLPELSRSGD